MNSSLPAVLLAIGAGLCWGTGEVCTKSVLASGHVGPFAAVMVRTIVALPIAIAAYLLAAAVLRSEPTTWPAAPARTMWTLLLGTGVFAGALGVLCFYAALRYGEISVVKPIAFALAPAAGVLLAWLFLGEHLGPQKIAGLAIVILGIVVLTTAAKPHTPHPAPPGPPHPVGPTPPAQNHADSTPENAPPRTHAPATA